MRKLSCAPLGSRGVSGENPALVCWNDTILSKSELRAGLKPVLSVVLTSFRGCAPWCYHRSRDLQSLWQYLPGFAV